MVAKQSGRVNLKLLAVLGIAVVLIVAVFVIAALFGLFGTSVEERIRLGDEFVAQGDYTSAISQYGRALNEDTMNVVIAQKYIDAIEKAPAEDVVQARRYLQQMQEWSRRIAELYPENSQLLRDHYAMMVDFAERLDGPGFYRQLAQLTDAKLQRDPDNIIARRYRGIARMQSLSPDASRDLAEQTREDLLMAAEAFPDDPEVGHELARWYLVEAQRVQQEGGAQEQVQPVVEEAVIISEQTLAQDPDDPQRQINHIEIMMHPMVDRESQITDVVAQLEENIADSDNPQKVLEVAQVLTRVDDQPVEVESGRTISRGVLRAEQLLENALEKDPNEKVYLLALARLLRQQGRNEDALNALLRVRELANQGNAIDVLRDNEMQLGASFDAANLMLARADSIDDPAERERLYNEVDKLAQELEKKTSSETGLVNALRGKLLYARGDLEAAAMRLERASNQFFDSNPELLLLLARIYRKLEMTGVASDKLEDLLRVRPDLIDARVELAELRVRNREFGQAQSLLNEVLADAPDHRGARQLRANMLAVQGQLDQAIEIYLDLYDVEEHPKLLTQLVRLMYRNDQAEEARELVEQRLEVAPDDLTAAVLLIRMTEDPEQREQILTQVESAGADAQTVARIRERMNRTEDLSIEEQIDLIQDPFTQQLARAELAWRNEDLEEAKALVDEMSEESPDNKRLMQLQFNIAVTEQDWTTARRLVEKASTLNLDQVGGLFWRARLLEAQGDEQGAIAAYEQALSDRPLYAEGHRRFADLLLRTRAYSKAVEHYETTLAQDPDNLEALRGLIQAQDQLGQHIEAINTIRRAVSLYPSNQQLIMLYINYEEEHGSKERAESLRRQLTQLAPQDFENRRRLAILTARRDRVDEAMAQMQDLINEEGRTRANVLTLARIYAMDAKTQQGLEVIQQYINDRDEPAIEDYLLAARFLLSNGMSEQAVEWYFKAMELEDPVNREVSRELADVAFANARFEQAYELYKQILSSKLEDQGVRLRMVETLIKLRRWDEASEMLAGVEEQTATTAVLKALIATGQDNQDAALQTLNQAIKRWPDNSMLYFQRAVVLSQTQDGVMPAMKDLDLALIRDPRAMEPRQLLVRLHLQKGEINDAIRELRAMLSQQPESVPIRLQLFNLYLNRGDTLSAAGLAEEAQRLFPGDPTWPKAQARVAEMENDQEQMRESWEQAVEMAPNPQHIASLTETMLRQDQPSDAIRLLKNHVEKVNSEPLLQALRGRALAMLGMQQQAKDVLAVAMKQSQNVNQFDLVVQQAEKGLDSQQAMQLVENTKGIPDIWKVLTEARMEVAAGRFQQAASQLQDAEKSLGSDLAMRRMFDRLMSVSLHQAGDYEGARKYYERLVELDGQDVTSLNNLAFLLAKQRMDMDRALQLAQRSAQIAPDSAEILDTLGFIQLQLGRVEEARETLARSIAIRPLPANLLHMGIVQRQLDNPDEAERLLQEAIRLAEMQSDQQVKVEAEQVLLEMKS